ncbi:MAG: UDP-N-acetylmuramoyl-L-alanyl-D-glutamate--2,6-diaminopimelate ligase [Patescibacteria group bacterium]
MKELIKHMTPRAVLGAYHLVLAYLGALFYGFPAKNLFVIAVTGTKGKSTTVELIDAILREAGYTTAVASTIRFAIGGTSEPNLYKMTMPGRFFLQQFLRKAVSKKATHAIIEMTSEGAAQFRHKGIELDALVFTNLAPEHLESHGGLENYVAAKLSLAKHLEESAKRPRYIVANADDKYGKDFLATKVEVCTPFSLTDAEPYNATDRGVRFVWRRGELFTVPLPGVFNLKNVLAALVLCEAMDIPLPTIKKALERMPAIAGRAERVEQGQPFTVVVDYAHTPDSLKALYETYGPSSTPGVKRKLVCVLGSTGGGRDTWKRPRMGEIADQFCDIAFLTDEDPYDEDPQKIIADIVKGFVKHKPHIIRDRAKAIREALKEAGEGDAVLITGKGTDPCICRAHGTKEPWSDRKVAQEQLKKLGYH